MSSPFPPLTSTPQKFHTISKSTGRSLLKRALVGIVLLVVMVSGGAWLMHAGIDRDAETQLAWPDESAEPMAAEVRAPINR